MMGYLFDRIVGSKRDVTLTDILPAINSRRGIDHGVSGAAGTDPAEGDFPEAGQAFGRNQRSAQIQTMSYPNLSALLEAHHLSGREPVGLDAIAKRLPDVDREDNRRVHRRSDRKVPATPARHRDPRNCRRPPLLNEARTPRRSEAFLQAQTPATRLSLAALETLAVIAYKQPVTIPEIQEIRGVQASGVIKTLLDKKLVATAGRKEVLGRPILYKTTKEFLIHFGLKDLSELPSMEEFEELIKNQATAEETLQTEFELPS